MSKYNGWSSYETWHVNLEVVDGMTVEDFGFNPRDVKQLFEESSDCYPGHNLLSLAESIEEMVVEVTTRNVPEGLALTLVENFLYKVNYVEIAESLVNNARGG